MNWVLFLWEHECVWKEGLTDRERDRWTVAFYDTTKFVCIFCCCCCCCRLDKYSIHNCWNGWMGWQFQWQLPELCVSVDVLCVCVVCVWFFCICICDSLEIVYILLFMAETYYILFPVIVYCCFILFCLFFSLENLIQFPVYTWLVYYLVSKLPRRLLYTTMRTIV